MPSKLNFNQSPEDNQNPSLQSLRQPPTSFITTVFKLLRPQRGLRSPEITRNDNVSVSLSGSNWIIATGMGYMNFLAKISGRNVTMVLVREEAGP